jgi:hypothetical protein
MSFFKNIYNFFSRDPIYCHITYEYNEFDNSVIECKHLFYRSHRRYNMSTNIIKDENNEIFIKTKKNFLINKKHKTSILDDYATQNPNTGMTWFGFLN